MHCYVSKCTDVCLFYFYFFLHFYSVEIFSHANDCVHVYNLVSVCFLSSFVLTLTKLLKAAFAMICACHKKPTINGNLRAEKSGGQILKSTSFFHGIAFDRKKKNKTKTQTNFLSV